MTPHAIVFASLQEFVAAVLLHPEYEAAARLVVQRWTGRTDLSVLDALRLIEDRAAQYGETHVLVACARALGSI